MVRPETVRPFKTENENSEQEDVKILLQTIKKEENKSQEQL